jgi:histidinol-phosphatase (PHP family)
MVLEFDGFEVLAHIDFPVRYWLRAAGPFDADRVSDEYHDVLRALAASGRALEVNTRVPLDARILRWWHDVGGQAITFASDAHEPAALATRFADAVQMAQASGFRPSRDPIGLWGRD